MILTCLAVPLPMAADWTSGQSWIRFGLPVLVLLVSVVVWAWGRQQQRNARSRIGSKGGFGGPPGTSDIGTEREFGIEGRGPNPHSGRTAVLAGLFGMAVGGLLLLAMLVWKMAG